MSSNHVPPVTADADTAQCQLRSNSQDKLTYQPPRITNLGNGVDLIQSQSYGGQLDGDSNPNFRHKQA